MSDETTVTGVFAKAVAQIKDLINYGGEKPAPKKKDGIFNIHTKSLLEKVDD